MNTLFLIVTLGITGYVLARIASARRLEEIEENERDGFRRRIAQDPKNIGAHEALGDSLRRAGRLDEARDSYLQALDAGSDDLILDEARDSYLQALDAGSDDLILDKTRYKLKQVDADIRERDGRAAPTTRELEFCRRCGAANPPACRHCETCGNLLPLPSFWEALREREVQRSSLEGICVFTIVVALVRTLYFLPLEIQGALIMSTVIVVGWWVLRSIEGRRG